MVLLIDICGVPPEGSGILHLRKSIIQTKYKYDASSEDRQTVWKRMIINFIERYFYLVCFAAYAKVVSISLSMHALYDGKKEHIKYKIFFRALENQDLKNPLLSTSMKKRDLGMRMYLIRICLHLDTYVGK